MELRATPTTVGGVPTVSVDGVVDMASIAVFRDALLRSVHAHRGSTVIVDLDGVTALDDWGLGVLLGAAAAARQADGDLEIVCNNERLRTRLDRTRLNRAITVRASITMTPDEPIFHIALPSDWASAFTFGEYGVSTRGRSLDDVGFIHCSTRSQVEATANSFYGDLTELVLLTIDPRAVPVDIVWEPPALGIDELFPHIYGPLPIAAVNMTTFWIRHADEWQLAD